jgi:hypothetical protein
MEEFAETNLRRRQVTMTLIVKKTEHVKSIWTMNGNIYPMKDPWEIRVFRIKRVTQTHASMVCAVPIMLLHPTHANVMLDGLGRNAMKISTNALATRALTVRSALTEPMPTLASAQQASKDLTAKPTLMIAHPILARTRVCALMALTATLANALLDSKETIAKSTSTIAQKALAKMEEFAPTA